MPSSEALSRGVSDKEVAYPFEGKLLVSPDFAVLDRIIISSGGSAKARIQLTPELLASFKGMPLESIRGLRHTPRSRYAQAFVEVEDPGLSIYNWFLDNGISSIDDIDPSLSQPVITFTNKALRTNIIREGARVFRLYYPGGEYLHGDELLNSPIRINDMPLNQTHMKKNGRETSAAIRMTFDNETRRYIPEGELPINIDPDIEAQRQLKDLLIPTPVTGKTIPYIIFSQERLYIPPGYYGLVQSYGYSKQNGRETHRSLSAHGESQLLDEGRDWHIIFELTGSTTLEEAANYIDVYIFKAT